jgi:hypothetical protein
MHVSKDSIDGESCKIFGTLKQLNTAQVQLNDVDGVEGKHNVFVAEIKRVAHHNSQTATTRSWWPTVF